MASEPTACATSARASSKAREYERRRSRVITGTIRPAKPSQKTAGSSPRIPSKPSKRTAGNRVIAPNAVAFATRFRGIRSPARTPVASANERLAATAPTVKASGSLATPGDSARTRPAVAGATPRARDCQKRLPYSRIVSATNWPTVRVSGGNGGGAGCGLRRLFWRAIAANLPLSGWRFLAGGSSVHARPGSPPLPPTDRLIRKL